MSSGPLPVQPVGPGATSSAPAPPPTNIAQPGATVTHPTHTVQLATVTVFEREWFHLAHEIGRMTNPIPWARELGWSCISLCGAALLALIPWSASYGHLPAAAQQSFEWVTPLLWILALFAAVLATLSFSLFRKVEKVIRSEATSVLEEMEGLHPLPPRTDQGAARGRIARLRRRMSAAIAPR
jgi:hypothetical protein